MWASLNYGTMIAAKFEFIINLQTAEAINLTSPRTLKLLRL